MPARRSKRDGEASHTFRALLIELPIYAVLVVVYFFAVLHFIAGWLGQLKANHNTIYAFVCIALIMGQAVALEWITTLLLRLFRGRSE
ncbi:MAG: hypothetical protein M3032_02830 [Verrucomicrobiota bacterium]|nr:hypothetical protein [Verrucomicrobiota bacterium]